ncbi:MAG: redoxin domain-containing protein, partial [Planctomycetota bacterium]
MNYGIEIHLKPLKKGFFISVLSAFTVLYSISYTLASDSPKFTQGDKTVVQSLDGAEFQIPSSSKYSVLCFLGIECPLVKLYAPRVETLSQKFDSEKFQFLALNSNIQDTPSEWTNFAKTSGLTIPLIKDRDHRVADQFKVTRTPEVVVVSPAGKVVYRGRIDDQYSPGVVRSKVERRDLEIALDEISRGVDVSVAKTEPEGCLIGRRRNVIENPTYTYAKDIAPIFQKNCLECHRQGEIGPFSMEEYEEVVGWGDMILEVIDNGRMPPWHADPRVGRFANSRNLSHHEKEMIRTWVAEGSVFGDQKDLAGTKKFTQDWRLPKSPDAVIEMRNRPFEVPADGTIEYQYFVVDPGFNEDKWVTAAEVVPGNRAIVHHSIVFIRPPDGKLGSGTGTNWLGAYVPGQSPMRFKQGRARKVPAGSKLVFQQHYTPNGTAQSDLTKIGLVFVDESEVNEELVTLAAINQEFEIRPHAENTTVTANIPWLPSKGKLLSVSPHMHYRGSNFQAKAVASGDIHSEEPILNVPAYDFNWQHVYEFETPIPLEGLDEVRIEVGFDNSENNPFNPDPSQYVVWGDQTWEEMAIGFFNVSIPRAPAQGSDFNGGETVSNERLDQPGVEPDYS